jgi:predicted ferric reductase
MQKPNTKKLFPGGLIITGKSILITIIAATSILPLIFIDLNEPSDKLLIYKILAKIGSLTGGMFLIWQFFLGFRGIISKIYPDLSWVVELHKFLGKYGMLLIPLHPVFIGLYYIEKFNVDIYSINLEEAFSQYVLLGIVLAAIIIFIVITSAFLREKLGFWNWFYTHLSSYLVPPLLFIHSLNLGTTIGSSNLIYFWQALTGIMILLYLYRLLHKLGIFSKKYETKSRETVGDEITEVIFEPKKDFITPAIGQFVYIRENIYHNSHPYTVSSFNESKGEMGITAKVEGPQTKKLQGVKEGTPFIIDGPYGVFTRVARASDDPFIMIAGGIGITAFRRLWRDIEKKKDREAWLFYANEYLKDVAFKKEVDELTHIRVVHVLNQEPNYEGEKGLVTLELINKYVKKDLKEYQILICGPPIMIDKLEEEFSEAGIPEDRIKNELFST